jgi:hypothetical protein
MILLVAGHSCTQGRDSLLLRTHRKQHQGPNMENLYFIVLGISEEKQKL